MVATYLQHQKYKHMTPLTPITDYRLPLEPIHKGTSKIHTQEAHIGLLNL